MINFNDISKPSIITKLSNYNIDTSFIFDNINGYTESQEKSVKKLIFYFNLEQPLYTILLYIYPQLFTSVETIPIYLYLYHIDIVNIFNYLKGKCNIDLNLLFDGDYFLNTGKLVGYFTKDKIINTQLPTISKIIEENRIIIQNNTVASLNTTTILQGREFQFDLLSSKQLGLTLESNDIDKVIMNKDNILDIIYSITAYQLYIYTNKTNDKSFSLLADITRQIYDLYTNINDLELPRASQRSSSISTSSNLYNRFTNIRTSLINIINIIIINIDNIKTGYSSSKYDHSVQGDFTTSDDYKKLMTSIDSFLNFPNIDIINILQNIIINNYWTGNITSYSYFYYICPGINIDNKPSILGSIGQNSYAIPMLESYMSLLNQASSIDEINNFTVIFFYAHLMGSSGLNTTYNVMKKNWTRLIVLLSQQLFKNNTITLATNNNTASDQEIDIIYEPSRILEPIQCVNIMDPDYKEIDYDSIKTFTFSNKCLEGDKIVWCKAGTNNLSLSPNSNLINTDWISIRMDKDRMGWSAYNKDDNIVIELNIPTLIAGITTIGDNIQGCISKYTLHYKNSQSNEWINIINPETNSTIFDGNNIVQPGIKSYNYFTGITTKFIKLTAIETKGSKAIKLKLLTTDITQPTTTPFATMQSTLFSTMQSTPFATMQSTPFSTMQYPLK